MKSLFSRLQTGGTDSKKVQVSHEDLEKQLQSIQAGLGRMRKATTEDFPLLNDTTRQGTLNAGAFLSLRGKELSNCFLLAMTLLLSARNVLQATSVFRIQCMTLRVVQTLNSFYCHYAVQKLEATVNSMTEAESRGQWKQQLSQLHREMKIATEAMMEQAASNSSSEPKSGSFL